MELVNITSEILLFLFCVGFVSGLVDSIAGGGGLIALPALLFIGLPPQMALGTNKLQGSFGTFTAAWNYIKKGPATLREAVPGIFFTLLGATSGTLLIQSLDSALIKPLIPVLLLLVFIYTLFSGHLGKEDRAPKMNKNIFYALFGICLGFYDGFFGPGTGSFWTVAFMFFAGFNMTKATGYTKIMNFTSNIVALFWFILGGNVVYSIGLTMAAGQVVGARIGSNLAIKNGTGFIRPIFLTVVLFTIMRLVYMNYISIT
ncbi:MAG: TSUP family transporter [Deltaproteobacteria bacterium]|nr:TSUP family transporter [Deltaproteobacteria bacterium]